MKKISLQRTDFGVVYTPEEGERRPGAMYPRAICLEHNGGANGTLLATFEQYTYDVPVFSIYKSEDSGLSWKLYSKVHDTKNGWGMRFQPQLFEVPQKTGCLNEGDILCAGNSIPADRSKTQLQLYRSTDRGATWSYLSTVVTGGVAETRIADPGVERPVWEPYLYLDKDGDLVVYYSDERLRWSDHCDQILCHQVSKDGGQTWAAAVTDVAIPDDKLRPGMPVVVRLPNGKYFMVYEMVNLEQPFVYGRLSDDGLDWGDPADYGIALQCEDGFKIASTPYCTWVPQGGPNGTIIVSGRWTTLGVRFEDPGYFLINHNNGEGPWEKIESLTRYDGKYRCCGYSQSMTAIDGGKKLLQLSSIQIGPQLCQIGYGIGTISEV